MDDNHFCAQSKQTIFIFKGSSPLRKGLPYPHTRRPPPSPPSVAVVVVAAQKRVGTASSSHSFTFSFIRKTEEEEEEEQEGEWMSLKNASLFSLQIHSFPSSFSPFCPQTTLFPSAFSLFWLLSSLFSVFPSTSLLSPSSFHNLLLLFYSSHSFSFMGSRFLPILLEINNILVVVVVHIWSVDRTLPPPVTHQFCWTFPPPPPLWVSPPLPPYPSPKSATYISVSFAPIPRAPPESRPNLDFIVPLRHWGEQSSFSNLGHIESGKDPYNREFKKMLSFRVKRHFPKLSSKFRPIMDWLTCL